MSPAQLDLFGSKAMQELRAENAWLIERLETARIAYRRLREERDALAIACGELEAEREGLQQQLSAVRATARTMFEQRMAAEERLETITRERDFWRRMASEDAALRAQPCLEIWLGKELRKLLLQAHPDKWSQGQPAIALAHELSVALNTLRARVGGVT